jgi:small subunit ribosomal protein S20
MPVIKSAKKKMRQSEKHARHNRQIKDTLKDKIKAVKLSEADSVAENLSKAYSEIDRAAKRNIIHKNTAARKKSKLAKLVATKSSESTTEVKKVAAKKKKK